LRLPRRSAYGVSVTWRDSVVCIGGQNETENQRDCFRMIWRDGAIEIEALPSLPRACAFACGALIDDTVYVSGGIEKPNDTTAMKTLWALDLAATPPTWREFEPCPGPGRTLSVAAAWGGEFFLIGGTALNPGPDGKPVRTPLREAHAYRANVGWRRLADLPRAMVAAPSPALSEMHGLTVFSGDDGTKVDFSPVEQHPGFPKDALFYDPAGNRWSDRGAVPFSLATAPTTVWHGLFIIVNGETRPRVRSNEVWAAKLP
jgi:N-acetylneuraminic acid mutarotase